MNERISTLKDGARIVLPDDWATMTTYIVEEQGDWFEDELPFIRMIVGPGDKVVDIGANFGLYTLAMAKRVGPSGSVLAFEPTPTTASFLRKSLALNGFTWVRLQEEALSDKEGNLELSIGQSPELNQLGASPAGGKSVTVKVQTIAHYESDLAGVSFIKLDAEGAEVAILDGSGKVLEREDPLVMFELRHGTAVNHALVDAFTKRGFGIYRFIPGLGALRPANLDSQADTSSLNLFAAKPSRAKELASRSRLVSELPAKVELDRTFGADLWGRAAQKKLVKGKDVPASIAWYAMATAHAELPVRAFAFDRALEAASRDVEQRPTLQRRLTLARIAREAGNRMLAMRELAVLLREVDPELVESDAPFLNTLPRYDTLDPGQTLGEFLAPQIIEAFARLHAYSSYFAGAQQVDLLEAFDRYRFPEPEMRRRLAMVQKRFGREYE